MVVQLTQFGLYFDGGGRRSLREIYIYIEGMHGMYR